MVAHIKADGTITLISERCEDKPADELSQEKTLDMMLTYVAEHTVNKFNAENSHGAIGKRFKIFSNVSYCLITNSKHLKCKYDHMYIY